MNKIIIAGHPQSGFERVEKQLLACGMANALPSRREGFTPAQIGEALIKAHGEKPVQDISEANELNQITVAPIWQGLALDLMLANMNQPLWGWADTQVVYLLEYWKTQDPQTQFVLVYDAPEKVITSQALNKIETDPAGLEAKIQSWAAYNAALLSFHLRNTERSLLVHADLMANSAGSYLQQLNARINGAVQLGDKLQTSEAAIELNASKAPIAVPEESLCNNALAQWLAQQLLEEHPDAKELYAQLQAAASFPQPVQHLGQLRHAERAQAAQRYTAWKIFAEQQVAMQQAVEHLAQKKKELQLSIDEKDLLRGQLQKAQQEPARQCNSELEQENQLLWTQLHKVQEELERYFLGNHQAKGIAKKPLPQGYYGAADRVKQQLSYRLGATMIVQSRSVKGWLTMPFALGAEAKRFKQGQAVRVQQKLPPIAQYRDAHEAERIKQHLSYRLGARMISNAKSLSGWISMPWALLEEVNAFRKMRR